MLKALELQGFKSFADKTRFEFPPGITVVVGPNGSGKSNVVDAIKWVLGEQSVKSMRGKEMADVIFKGSGGGGNARGPANAAEVTIVFENEQRRIPIDEPEVHVTRRVYRSGDGEYLINGNPCRLRDVKDLFRGTGVGTDAYSLIEQGKVDTLLQASPRERRAIFEEAAGISRFKAKKIETQRRLERVELNLQRLADIVDEVASRLRTVRSQATKARRYQEYTKRLQELRTHVGLADFRQLTTRLTAGQEQLEATGQQVSQLEAQVQRLEGELQQAETLAEGGGRRLRQLEARRSQLRQQLAEHRSVIAHQRERLAELEHEITRYRRQWLAMTARAGDLGLQLQQVREQLEQAETLDAEVRSHWDELTEERHRIAAELVTVVERQQATDRQLADAAQQRAELERRRAGLQAEQQSAEKRLEEIAERLAALKEPLQESDSQSKRLGKQRSQLADQLADAQKLAVAARERLDAADSQRQQLERQRTEQERVQAADNERLHLLKDLEQRQEGLNAAVKQLLAAAQNTATGPLATIRGLAADLIRVDVQMAPLIDIALGPLTQYLIVDGPTLLNAVAAGEIPVQGRVGLLDATANGVIHTDDSAPNLTATSSATLATERVEETDVAGDQQGSPFLGEAGILGRADEFVETDSRYQPLVARLLRATWCVDTLADANRLRQKYGGNYRFVTRSGELVEPDGRALLGARHGAVGLVSRRSELLALQQKVTDREQALVQLGVQAKAITAERVDAARAVSDAEEREQQLAQQVAELRLHAEMAAQRTQSLEQQLQATRKDHRSTEQQRDEAQRLLADLETKLEQLHQQSANFQQEAAQIHRQRQQLVESVQQFDRQLTQLQVERAKSEQRVDDLRGQIVRCEKDHRERYRSMQEIRGQLQAARARQERAELAILSARSGIATAIIEMERLAIECTDLETDRAQLSDQLHRLRQEFRQARSFLHSAEQQFAAQQLDVQQTRLERETLTQRVREDYGVDLQEIDLPIDTDGNVWERDVIDREIEELRTKLSNIGAVNMAALEEIEELERRHETLASQYQDLVDAKDALVRIIQRINADSRRLFTESLSAIRDNFQALFRRVFGGGEADIVLEEGMDILEAGIDIVATPPGKQSLSISLLSGGERALTAVTLLMAIFQYRPSPFCVLDEVDGPLDEANIGRFIDVLREFLQWTKFVVVTHSKKTMTAATTLYGVTMQESGISKRVSVQFEDVGEDGHIRSSGERGAA